MLAEARPEGWLPRRRTAPRGILEDWSDVGPDQDLRSAPDDDWRAHSLLRFRPREDEVSQLTAAEGSLQDDRLNLQTKVKTGEALRITAVSPPFDSPAVAQRAIEVIARAEGMGLLAGVYIEHLDLSSFRHVVARIASIGIGRDVETALAAPRIEAVDIDRLLSRLREAIEESPAPEFEWPTLVNLFGTQRLSALTGTSTANVRRYAAGEHETPDTVAARLHFLAGLVGQLAGAYNDFGIRRWFERKRTALDGRSPAALLRGDWSPEDPEARRVRELAASLSASPVT